MKRIDAAHLETERARGAVVIDVRTPEEFEEGHIPGAYNLPWSVRAADRGLVPNPRFTEHARHLFTHDQSVWLVCRSGVRSAAAARALAEVGYQHLGELDGGMEGVRDAFGSLTTPGWKQSGAPLAHDHERDYAQLFPTQSAD